MKEIYLQNQVKDIQHPVSWNRIDLVPQGRMGWKSDEGNTIRYEEKESGNYRQEALTPGEQSFSSSSSSEYEEPFHW